MNRVIFGDKAIPEALFGNSFLLSAVFFVLLRKKCKLNNT